MKKKFYLRILLLTFCFVLVPVFGFAEDKAGADADNDELFRGYIEQQLNINKAPQKAMLRSKTASLTDANLAVYNLLKEDIRKVAAGESSGTVFEIPLDALGLEKTEWTASELGLETIYDGDSLSDEAFTAVNEAIGFDFEKVYNNLLANCPYDLYWHDKTARTDLAGPRVAYWSYGSEEYIELVGGFILSFPVAEGYSAGDYTVDTSKGQRVQSAVAKANAIVSNHAAATDFEKLDSYRQEICGLVDYDRYAAEDDSTPYGDPWQIVSVFDGDDKTNVVCEGYAKAFQYLCDLTDFTSDRITCSSVSGIMSGGTGAGNHMWNVVTMNDGKNYLVDVTNCDEGAFGAPDQLFLRGASGSVSSRYSIACDRGTVLYKYDNDTLMIFDSGDLELADSDYDKTYTETVTVTIGVYDQTKNVCSRGGTYTFNAEDMTHTSGKHIVETGSQVELVAAPAKGYEFAGWYEGVVVGGDNLMVRPVGEVGDTNPAARFTARKDVVLCAAFTEIEDVTKPEIDLSTLAATITDEEGSVKDIAEPGDTVTISVGVTDDLAVKEVYMVVDTPNGGNFGRLMSYNEESGYYELAYKIEKTNLPGDYKIYSIQAEDLRGNLIRYYGSQTDLTAGKFTVKNDDADLVEPEIDADSLSMTISGGKDHADVGDTVTISIRASDNVELSSVRITINMPGSGSLVSPMSYNGASGCYELAYKIDSKTHPGEYTIKSITATDTSYNQKTLTENNADLTAGSFTVENDGADTVPPVIDLSTLAAEISGGKDYAEAGDTVSLSVKATDDVELSSVYIVVDTPDGGNIGRSMTYNSLSGCYQFVLTIDNRSPLGEYKIYSIRNRL